MSMKKKLVGMLASLALVVGLVPTAAFAANDASLTVTAGEDSRTFELYQVFKGDYDAASKNLSNIVWGDSITDPAAFVAILKAMSYGNPVQKPFETLADDATADTVAELMVKDDAEFTIAFANAVGKYLDNKNQAPLGVDPTKEASGTDTNYKYQNLAHGYYMVKDVTTDLPEGSTNSRYMIQVAGNAQVNIKTTDVPELTKKITRVDDSTGAQRAGKPDKAPVASTVGVNDTVYFELSSTVPNVTGYNQYKFMIEDTISAGLDFADNVETSAEVKLNGNKLTKDTDYTVDKSADGKTIQIYFKNCLAQFTGKAGQAITVTYTAKVNENAKSGNVGENNAAHVVYTKNPGDTSTGDKPDPNETDVYGKTPDQKTYVYTTEITIKKTDKEGNTLTGAEFKLTGANLLTTSVTIKNTFAPSDTGAWYKLTDGTYTQTAPAPGTEDKYEKKPGSTTDYQMYEATQQKTSVPADGYAVTATVDESGNLTFKGLLPGDYTLTETKAPDGYNKLANDITFTVTGSINQLGDSCDWTVTTGKDPNFVENNDENQVGLGTYNITIKNKAGSSLPSTGSIGTVLFYLIGGVLMIGAVAFFITKRRLAHKQ